MSLLIVIAVALAASILAGGILCAGIALLVRLRPFDATTRHALWFATLIALALLPVAGVTASVMRAVHAPGAVAVQGSRSPSAFSAHASFARGAGAQAPAERGARSGLVRSNDLASASGDRTVSSSRTFAIPGFVALAALVVIVLVALAGLVGLVVSLMRIGAVKRRSSPLDESLAGDLPWLTETHEGRETYLRLSYEIEAPVAIGFSRPVILIPTDLATKSGLSGIEDLVIHEHAHLNRYDDYTNLVQRSLERMFWFNPFVWFVGRRVALEREIAADDAVVARTADSARYADALWRLAREMRMPAFTVVAPGALFTRKQISVRIEALLAPGRAHLRHLGPASVAGALGIALVSCAIVAFAAPPLQLPASPAAQGAVVAKAPHGAAHEDTVVALDSLSGLIDSRLSDLKATVEASSTPSPDRIADLRHELRLLRDKLNVMRHEAVTDDLSDLSQRIADLEARAASLDAALRAKVTSTLVASHFTTTERAAPGAPAAPPVPGAKPAPAGSTVNVDTPRVDVNVPAVDVDAAGVSVHVPAVNVHVPAMHIHAPKQVAYNDGDDANDNESHKSMTLTRELLAHCNACDLAGRDLRNLDLHGLSLVGVNLSHADLRGANLSHVQLSGADLSHARLDGADLTDAAFEGADIGGASFRGARMDGVSFTGISLADSDFDNASVREILMRGCSGCDLARMDLRGIDLHDINLVGADLSHTNLEYANLKGARFSGVNFDHANLNHVDLRDAELTGCSLKGASLNGVQLDGIKLSGTDISI